MEPAGKKSKWLTGSKTIEGDRGDDEGGDVEHLGAEQTVKKKNG